MRKILMPVLILFVAFGLLGCSSTSTVSSTVTPEMLLLATPESYPNPPSYPNPSGHSSGLPKLTGVWHIRLAQTGGIAGVSRTLEISSDGKLTATDERTQKQATGQLSSDELSKLTELVASTQYQEVKQPRGCADCFNYDLRISNGTDKFQAKTDDVNLPDTGLEPLVHFLAEILANHK